VSHRGSDFPKDSLPRRARIAPTSTKGQIPPVVMGDMELQTLHVRVIALENLVVSLLAAGSDRQLERARIMAANISPRSDITHHLLTVQAATHMIDLVERGSRFRSQARPK
jgi:hypothetical protein